MAKESPHVVIVAGPNGSGKSTIASRLLRDHVGVNEFVNADAIAFGLSAFNMQSVAGAAARIMLQRMRELADERASFAFETTLASRSFVPWIRNLRRQGYRTHLIFLWLPSSELAVARVRMRVAEGGHDVPEGVIRRRYHRGLDNLVRLYMPLMDSWRIVHGESGRVPRVIAQSDVDASVVFDAQSWQRIQEQSHG